ncbi:CRISPR-associated endoribonuclease Cas6 [Thermococcus barophilus]|uniref:CRISPR associated protein Cas6 C-terminal domain-containing protein n=1 Tax=Thermococcus barophilus TaxID=55802 RepID=A0A0S1XEV2_THEBA|nr:CRISPR-associated endoribonuclease Cas6 [Thermococcus barophilus]ALM76258.1 hypothetical protein TBCH5v1_2364 [Thermococcus barophilus]
MRLKLTLDPLESFPYDAVGKHAVQGFIYAHLSGTKWGMRHDEKRFKFFTFSDIFPSGNFVPGKPKTLIISSPDEGFIETLYEKMLPEETVYLGTHALRLTSLKKFRLRPKNKFITGSPIVLRSMRGQGYFTFYHEKSLIFFVTRITENARKKYEAFYNEPAPLDGFLFDRMIPRVRKNGWVDVYVRVKMHGAEFDIPGSTWKLLEKKITPENRKFYQFIMDAGVGELNSLGFGFINPVRD